MSLTFRIPLGDVPGMEYPAICGMGRRGQALPPAAIFRGIVEGVVEALGRMQPVVTTGGR